MKRNTKTIILDILTYIFLATVVVLVLMPLLWIISTSLKPAIEIFQKPPHWIPHNPTVSNYAGVITASEIPRAFLNSFLVGALATFLALALIVSLIESMIPPIVPALPYAKIGIGNVVLLACFLLVGTLDGYVVLVLRCLLNAVFSANMASLAWSLPSALAAYLVMTLLYKTKLFSVCGVSVVGGIVHNLMQICVASLIVGKSVFVYLPYMMLAGAIAGIVTFSRKFKTQPYVRQSGGEEDEVPTVIAARNEIETNNEFDRRSETGDSNDTNV